MIKINSLKVLSMLFALALLLAACAPGVIRQTATPALPPVDPKANVSAGRKAARLYFRVAEEAFIGSELRQVEIKADETAEEAVINSLLAGPDAALSQLRPLIPKDTKLVSLERSGSILFLKLSEEFLDTVMLMPNGWQQDTALRKAAELEKQLAISSIVNTLTELGSCERVLVLVEQGGALSDTPSEIMALFSGADPLPYSSDYVLTPKRALIATLEAVKQKDWAYVSRLVTSAEPLTETRLSDELNAPGALTDYVVGEDSTASDGSTSTIPASVTLKGEDGVERTRESIPVRAVQVQEVFRIEYESLLHLLGSEND